MKILCLGGTKFIGRQFVQDALELGHEVSILQRGSTNHHLFPQVRRFLGDRRQIRDLIGPDERFDLVVDTSGYHPDLVRASCEYLRDKTSLYIFVSTCSVYKDFSHHGLNENSEIAKLESIPHADDPISAESYGALKALCENEVRKSFREEHSLILRPCIIVGPYDETGRFDRLIKLLMGKELIVPDDPNAHIQFVDVRALSSFMLSAFSSHTRGTFNTVGPKKPLKFLDFIGHAGRLLNPSLKLNLQSPEDMDFPMYVNDPSFVGFFSFDGRKAYKVGFPDISLENTLSATRDYVLSRSEK